MAEIEGALGRQFQSLSIVFVCAVNTKLASLWAIKFLLQIYMELTGCLLPLQTVEGWFFKANFHSGKFLQKENFVKCDWPTQIFRRKKNLKLKIFDF